MRRTLPLWLLLLTGCGGGGLSGTVVQAFTQAPLSGLRLLAKADSPDASLTCRTQEATTDAAGVFSFKGLCGGTSYTVVDAEDSFWFADFEGVPDGGIAEPVTLAGYPMPTATGLYHIDDGVVKLLKTGADVKREVLFGTSDKQRYASKIPGRVPKLGAGDYIVFGGQKVIDDLVFHRLITTKIPVQVGKRKVADTMVASWVDVRFTSDTSYEPAKAAVDNSQQLDKSRGDRVARFLPAAAVPAGRYAIFGKKGKRMYIVDFGG